MPEIKCWTCEDTGWWEDPTACSDPACCSNPSRCPNIDCIALEDDE